MKKERGRGRDKAKGHGKNKKMKAWRGKKSETSEEKDARILELAQREKWGKDKN